MSTKVLSTALNMQKCSDNIGNRFDMVLIASHRTREIQRGYRKLVDTQNSPVVTALQEIEAGLIGREYLKKL
jgi:DNA-directed RNA polymerase omega subunit